MLSRLHHIDMSREHIKWSPTPHHETSAHSVGSVSSASVSSLSPTPLVSAAASRVRALLPLLCVRALTFADGDSSPCLRNAYRTRSSIGKSLYFGTISLHSATQEATPADSSLSEISRRLSQAPPLGSSSQSRLWFSQNTSYDGTHAALIAIWSHGHTDPTISSQCTLMSPFLLYPENLLPGGQADPNLRMISCTPQSSLL